MDPYLLFKSPTYKEYNVSSATQNIDYSYRLQKFQNTLLLLLEV